MSQLVHQLDADDAIVSVQAMDLFGHEVRVETTRRGFILVDGVLMPTEN